jgi:hypothetical protein
LNPAGGNGVTVTNRNDFSTASAVTDTERSHPATGHFHRLVCFVGRASDGFLENTFPRCQLCANSIALERGFSK